VNPLFDILSGRLRGELLKQEEIARRIKIRTNGSFVERLPRLEETSIKVTDRVLKQGTILKRPIYKKLAYFDISHYGWVFGTCVNQDRWVIDKDANGIIKATEFTEFMKGYDNDYLDYIDPPEDFCVKDTLNRSKEIESMPYSYRDSNCQRFVYFSVYGEDKSPIIDFVRENKAFIKDVKEKFKKL